MADSNIYETLGVKTIINAAGTFTDLGGSLMSPEVLAAWNEAARHFVDIKDLQDQVGVQIAQLLGVPAALVTGGAASGILLGVSAAITARYPEFVQQQHLRDHDHQLEVLQQKRHRDLYDRQIETCGVRIVEVETAEDVARLKTNQTVLMMAYNVYEPEGSISHIDWLRLAAEHSLPTLLDAAADTPPVENLWKFHQMGYDMVVFSGGKAIGGPQSSGLLLGRGNFIELAKQNATPNEGVIGRVAKVSKENIVALWRAVEIFVKEGDQIQDRCLRQLQVLASELDSVKTLESEFITPAMANHFPHLRITWDEAQLGLTVAELTAALRNGEPPIVTGRVHGTGSEGLLVSAINLQAAEEQIIAARIKSAFHGAMHEF